jgi:uncharacterized coiled-coil DUF342 family protein
MNAEEYVNKRREIATLLFKIEAERKKINAKWREATHSAKALDRMLLNEGDIT